MEASDWLRTEVNVAITFVCGRTADRIHALTTPSLFLRGCLPTPCFQHGRTHTKQIRGRSLKSKPREIQTESRQPYSFRFPNIAKLLFKRVKYISIRREKSLTQRGNNAAILDWKSDRQQAVVTRVVTIFMGGFWLAVLGLAFLAVLGLYSLAELLRMSFLNQLMFVI